MTMFLVSWPDETYSLAECETPLELYGILDEEGDPNGAKFREYDGSVYLSVTLHAPECDDDEDVVKIEPVGEMATWIIEGTREVDGWTTFSPLMFKAWIEQMV